MGSSSAMENWGLIVYTRFLSQHPFATPATARYTKRSLMCHEIAHQWFGDLVTADHWGQEFLHESFAAYFQNIANLLFQESNDDDE
uniref:Peptidase_M1 domain-containing protein n=1 Tax=Bursaphelenchus xylophilus TaxID=6326 RepID=A0A1I7SPP0_BURXY